MSYSLPRPLPGRVLALLDAEPSSACLLGTGGEILATNDAWDAFARENGGAPDCLGATLDGKTYVNFVDGLAARELVEAALQRVLAGVAVTLPSGADRCGHPGGLSSRFVPVRADDRTLVLVIHSRVAGPEGADAAGAYVGAGGRARVCPVCRRVQVRGGARWDAVAENLRRALTGCAEDGLCPTCNGVLAL